ncbi:sulfate anion transporter, conserved site [Sesbania bispinosa]|nr:sulfate anion transporter, conserved site [Sesbania bispinosa]
MAKNMEEIGSAASSRRHGDTLPHIHKVGTPPKQTLFQEIKHSVIETFFHDDPLGKFKDQSGSRKFVLGVQSVFPIFEWAKGYSFKKFRGDLIAGLTIASLCIPQDIAYANLANLEPQYGLYTSFVAPLVYAFMGSSRDIAIGPVAVVSLLLGTMLSDEISNIKSHEYLRLAFTATFFAGVTQMILGVFRLGFLIDFLSHAAIVGFMGGAAITIALQQLKVWGSVHHGVKHIKKGVNPASAHEIYFSGNYLGAGVKIGVIAGMIALTEAVAIGRTFAAMKDYAIDGNKEMVAMGTMNIIGSLTSCYVATGSFSRSAVNYMAGCSTAVSNIVMSIVVLLTLLVITPLFKYTPNAVLASIIIAAVINLVDIKAVILLWKIDKFDFVACMGAFFGVIFKSVEIGLLIAVAISFAKILLQVTRPRTALLGKLPGTNVYRNVQQYPNATQIPGMVIIRVDSAIYFSNSNYIKDRILKWLTDEEVQRTATVTDIDTSGIHALEDLFKSLQKREVQLLLANPGPIVTEKLHASKLSDLIGESKIFLSVGDAVATFGPKGGI